MRVPALGESVVSVTLSKWLKPDGAMVARDEPICEFETEKATQELGAENAGNAATDAARSRTQLRPLRHVGMKQSPRKK